MFALMFPQIISTTMNPIIGQNLGIKNIIRIKTAIKTGYMFTLIGGVITAVCLTVFSNGISSFFSPDKDVVSIVRLYLSIVPIGYGFYGVMSIATSSLVVFNKPLHSSGISLAQAFVFSIPLAYLGSLFFGFWAIFLALPLSYFISSVIAFFLLNKTVLDYELNLNGKGEKY